MLYGNEISPHFHVVYFELTVNICSGEVLVCRVIPGAELHADFSDRLAIAIVQDLALYANSGGCLRSSLKCEGSGNEASKKDVLHLLPKVQFVLIGSFCTTRATLPVLP